MTRRRHNYSPIRRPTCDCAQHVSLDSATFCNQLSILTFRIIHGPIDGTHDEHRRAEEDGRKQDDPALTGVTLRARGMPLGRGDVSAGTMRSLCDQAKHKVYAERDKHEGRYKLNCQTGDDCPGGGRSAWCSHSIVPRHVLVLVPTVASPPLWYRAAASEPPAI